MCVCVCVCVCGVKGRAGKNAWRDVLMVEFGCDRHAMQELVLLSHARVRACVRQQGDEFASPGSPSLAVGWGGAGGRGVLLVGWRG